MPENYNVVCENLPYKIKGFIMYDAADDYYTIVLNSRSSYQNNQETFKHELEHIINDDFHNYRDVSLLEAVLH